MTDPDPKYLEHVHNLRHAEQVVQTRTRYASEAIVIREQAIDAAIAFGMTQSEIARILGLSKQRISEMRKGRHNTGREGAL